METTAELAAVIRRSQLFDEAWYLERYPDVRMLGMDAAEHYLWLGARMGRDPSSRFDTSAYLEAYPDVAASGMNPLVHFERHGRGEGRTEGLLKASTAEPFDALKLGGPVPHYGIAMHRLVEEARSRMKPLGTGSREYEEIRRAFDVPYYLFRYHDIARATWVLDPVQHYIAAGASEGRDPSPDFSTKAYVRRYPDVSESGMNPFFHWLTIGRSEGRIALPYNDFERSCEVLGHDASVVQERLRRQRADLRERLERGKLGEMIAKAAEIDPLVEHAWGEALAVKMPPFHSEEVLASTVAMKELLDQSGNSPARVIIAVPEYRWGSGRRMEGHIAHALTDVHGAENIILLPTDTIGRLSEKRFPEGTRFVDFAALTQGMAHNRKLKLLFEYIRALSPSEVYCINSRMLWEVIRHYGNALKRVARINGCLFCEDRTIYGYWAGYPARFVYPHFEVLNNILTDSHFLARALIDRFQIPPAQQGKMKVLEAPVDPSQEVVTAPPPREGRRPTVFWAGRFDAQKRIDVVYRIAAAMPEADFRLWGEPVARDDPRLRHTPANVQLKGAYQEFSELPLQECDAWLYTSAWDGVPSILLEVAMTGIPIVGTLVGGTEEVLLEGMSWPIAEVEAIEAYATALRQIFADPRSARQRATQLRAHLAGRRTYANYRDVLLSMEQQSEMADRRNRAQRQ